MRFHQSSDDGHKDCAQGRTFFVRFIRKLVVARFRSTAFFLKDKMEGRDGELGNVKWLQGLIKRWKFIKVTERHTLVWVRSGGGKVCVKFLLGQRRFDRTMGAKDVTGSGIWIQIKFPPSIASVPPAFPGTFRSSQSPQSIPVLIL